MTQAIENLLREERSFPPPPEFAADANAQPGIHDEAEQDFAGFWLRNAIERVSWFKEPTVALDDSEAPFYRWFTDGTLNLSYNCLDRHLEERGDKIAYHWVGEPGDKRDISYQDLHREVCRFANALASLGVERGDRVAIYMGMVPELPVAMLACARIGAAHSVVFGGFSSDALCRPDRRRSGQGAGHPGRRLARGKHRPAQGKRRCRRGQDSVDRARRGAATGRLRGRHEGGP